MNNLVSGQEGRYTPYGNNSPQTENRHRLLSQHGSSATTSSMFQAYDEQKAVSRIELVENICICYVSPVVRFF